MTSRDEKIKRTYKSIINGELPIHNYTGKEIEVMGNFVNSKKEQERKQNYLIAHPLGPKITKNEFRNKHPNITESMLDKQYAEYIQSREQYNKDRDDAIEGDQRRRFYEQTKGNSKDDGVSLNSEIEFAAYTKYNTGRDLIGNDLSREYGEYTENGRPDVVLPNNFDALVAAYGSVKRQKTGASTPPSRSRARSRKRTRARSRARTRSRSRARTRAHRLR
jgi:hypothetical protein